MTPAIRWGVSALVAATVDLARFLMVPMVARRVTGVLLAGDDSDGFVQALTHGV
jgi:hypothetical protein